MKAFAIFLSLGILSAALAAVPEGEALKAHLQNQIFVDAPDGNYHELKFEGDKIQMQTFGPGGVPCSASFSVNGKVLNVKNPGSALGDGCALQTGKCTFLETPDSPVSAEALLCGESLFFNMNKPAPLGKEIKLDGAMAITLRPAKGELTTAAVFRKKPAKSGTAIKCSYYNAEMNGEPKAGLPPGFTVYARTKDKVKVDKWENYWYFVFSPNYDTQTCQSQFGWVFGEFVRPVK